MSKEKQAKPPLTVACINDGEENCMAACHSMRIFRKFYARTRLCLCVCVCLLGTHSVALFAHPYTAIELLSVTFSEIREHTLSHKPHT